MIKDHLGFVVNKLYLFAFIAVLAIGIVYIVKNHFDNYEELKQKQLQSELQIKQLNQNLKDKDNTLNGLKLEMQLQQSSQLKLEQTNQALQSQVKASSDELKAREKAIRQLAARVRQDPQSTPAQIEQADLQEVKSLSLARMQSLHTNHTRLFESQK